jgi:hypothetical protein
MLFGSLRQCKNGIELEVLSDLPTLSRFSNTGNCRVEREQYWGPFHQLGSCGRPVDSIMLGFNTELLVNRFRFKIL